MLRDRQTQRRGRAYRPAYLVGGAVFGVVVIAVVVSIATGSAQAFAHYGLSFVWSGTWSPANGQYATGILVVGTVVTTGAAMLLAAPIGLGAAIALSELVPRKVAAAASLFVELLAAVPSIVVGLWALLVLSPLFARHVEPFLRSIPGLGAAFSGPAYGPSILLAAIVLAVMTLPTLVALSRTALRGVPVEDREAAMALGATRWQVVRKVVIPTARPGIGAAVTLALGRAMGEAIAVALVIGNRPALPHSLIAPGATLGSAIVNQFAEAQPGLGNEFCDRARSGALGADRGRQHRGPDAQAGGQCSRVDRAAAAWPPGPACVGGSAAGVCRCRHVRAQGRGQERHCRSPFLPPRRLFRAV